MEHYYTYLKSVHHYGQLGEIDFYEDGGVFNGKDIGPMGAYHGRVSALTDGLRVPYSYSYLKSHSL
ncbi:MAG: hypothetical protein V7724_07650 [Sediminicola sp.]